jgi:hypothetical protein
MGGAEADRIYIAIGSGETFDAIGALITAIARERIPVSQALAATVSAWLDCYLGQDAEPRLRDLHRRGGKCTDSNRLPPRPENPDQPGAQQIDCLIKKLGICVRCPRSCCRNSPTVEQR